MFIFAIILICIVIPFAINFSSSKVPSNSEEVLETFLGAVDNDILGKSITGADLLETVGKRDTPPECATFYSDDFEFNPKAVATTICPHEIENSITFHIRGIFATHPNNTFIVNGVRSAKMKYVTTGRNVWVTFSNQHDSTAQIHTIAPGNSLDISNTVGFQASRFYNDFDVVKLLYTSDVTAIKTKGKQLIYPECLQVYEACGDNIDASTDGFMTCHNYKSKYVQLKGSTLENLWFDPIAGKVSVYYQHTHAYTYHN